MSITSDMVATYRGPRKVIARLLAMGVREDRALVILMAGCVVVFIAQWPRLAREAHVTGQELNPLLGGALLGWIFIAPLAFYLIAFISHIVLRLFGRKISGYAARIALFWSFFAATPLILLHGLIAGFIGAGVGLNVIGAIWFGLFLWFWTSGLVQAAKGGERDA